MSMTFTKLFSSITESSVWMLPDHSRIVWIAMLAMADKHGRVWASVPGLANRARVPVESTEAALASFTAPDQWSRTEGHEGRRIEKIDGGWRLLNHQKYREIRDDETERERNRIRQARFKAKVTEEVTEEVTPSNANSVTITPSNARSVIVTPGNPIAEADAEADADAYTDKTKKKKGGMGDVADEPQPAAVEKKAPLLDDDWLRSLSADPAYAGMDVPREHAKMVRWCDTNGKQPSRRRLINWLNRAERPMTATGSRKPESGMMQENLIAKTWDFTKPA